MDEVNVETVDLGDEVRIGIQLRLNLAPVIFSRPIAGERLPASVAAIGTMLVPVIGVVVSAIALREPLGLSQTAALVFTVAGVALAARS